MSRSIVIALLFDWFQRTKRGVFFCFGRYLQQPPKTNARVVIQSDEDNIQPGSKFGMGLVDFTIP